MSKPAPLSTKIIVYSVLFLFVVAWPADLVLHYQLARSGRLVSGTVEETREGRAKSGQVIYYSTVTYPAWGMTFRRTLSGPALQKGEQTPVQFAPLLPLYSELGSGPVEPPHTVTVVMRLLIGAVFSGVAVLVLRGAK